MKTRIEILKSIQNLYQPGFEFYITDNHEAWIQKKSNEIVAHKRSNDPRSDSMIRACCRSGFIFELGSTLMIEGYENPVPHNPMILESYDHDSRMDLEEEIRIEFKKMHHAQGDLDLDKEYNANGYPVIRNQIKRKASADLLTFGWLDVIDKEQNHYGVYWKFLVDGPSLGSMVQASHKAWGGPYYYMTEMGKLRNLCIEVNPMSGIVIPYKPRDKKK